jgi:hypothetical protein
MRQALKSDYLRIGRGIDAEAVRLTDLILEIEDPLDEQLKAIDQLKAAAKQEAERKEQEKLQGRVTSLIDAGNFV